RRLNVTAQVRGVRARGLAASPDIERANASAVWLFVNGRAIRDRQLTHAVLRAYGEVMPHGRYPAAILFLEVPPRDVDVNVHPAKAEVRLSDARDRKSTRLKLQSREKLVCRLLLEKKQVIHNE